jgi:FkbM family methyltransferase
MQKLVVAVPLIKYTTLDGFLTSIYPINNLIVLDHASTNDELGTLQTQCKQANINLYLYRSKTPNACAFNNELMQICNASQFEYVLFMNPYEKLSVPCAIPELTHDYYYITSETAQQDGIYHTKKIAITKTNTCHWVNDIYETLVPIDEDACTVSEFPASVVVIQTVMQSVMCTEHDVTQAYQVSPTNMNFRNIIQFYSDTPGHHPKFMTYCDLYIKHGKTKEMVYLCLLKKIQLCIDADVEWDVIFSMIWKTHEMYHTVEPLIHLVRHYIQDDNYESAHSLLTTMCAIEYPSNLKMYIKQSDYSFERWKLMQIVSMQLDKPYDIYRANQQLLLVNINPKERLKNYFKNLAISDTLKSDYKYRSTKPLMFVYTGPCEYYWNGDLSNTMLERKELAVINLINDMKTRGYHCVVCCNTEFAMNTGGVEYIPLIDYDSFVNSYHIEKMIVVNHVDKMKYETNIKSVYLWLQSCLPIGTLVWNEKLLGIITLTKSHKTKLLQSIHKQFHSLITVICNGVDVDLFLRKNIKTVRHRFVYTSRSLPPLDRLLLVFPKIHETYDDAELHIYTDTCTDAQKAVISTCPYIVLKDRVNTADMAKVLKSVDYWVNPRTQVKPGCLAAYEMQAASVCCITTGIGFFPYIVNDRGYVVDLSVENGIVDMISAIESNLEDKESKLRNGREWIMDQRWSDMCDLWIDFFNVREMEFNYLCINTFIETRPILFYSLKTDLRFSGALIEQESWEPHVTEWLISNLDATMTFIDVGSYLGYHSVASSYYCRDVYSYDINNEYTNVIKKNKDVNKIKNLKIHCFGLSDRRDIFMLHKHRTESANWLLETDDSVQYTQMTKQVKSETMDYLYRGRKDRFNKIIMKIDVNGYEPYVLRGSVEFIKVYRPVIIIRTEYHHLVHGVKTALGDDYVICET